MPARLILQNILFFFYSIGIKMQFQDLPGMTWSCQGHSMKLITQSKPHDERSLISEKQKFWPIKGNPDKRLRKQHLVLISTFFQWILPGDWEENKIKRKHTHTHTSKAVFKNTAFDVKKNVPCKKILIKAQPESPPITLDAAAVSLGSSHAVPARSRARFNRRDRQTDGAAVTATHCSGSCAGVSTRGNE